jgi:radical SAM superfamily enzyme YgiQ (UPF0313 family)
MKQAGCTFISYGLESGNEEILKKMKKGITISQVVKAVDITKKMGIKCGVHFIIGHIDETYETAMDTIKLASTIKADTIGIYNMVPFRGTRIYEWIKENGRFLFPENELLYKVTSASKFPAFETDEFPVHAREKVLKRAINLFEKRNLCFKFGFFFGYIFYYVSRPKIINKYLKKQLIANKTILSFIKKIVLSTEHFLLDKKKKSSEII